MLREKAANAGPQKFEDLADELDELAQLTWALKPRKRPKNDREVTSVDLLEAADILRQAGSAATGTDDSSKLRELIEKLRIRLSPREEQSVSDVLISSVPASPTTTHAIRDKKQK